MKKLVLNKKQGKFAFIKDHQLPPEY